MLIIIRGPPATGKSTLARGLAEHFKTKGKTAILIVDEFRWVMTAHEPRDEIDFKIAWANYIHALNAYLKAGYTVITEDTWKVGKRHKDRSTDINSVLRLAKRWGSRVYRILLKAEWKTIKNYNTLRSPPVWEPELKELFTKVYAQRIKGEQIINIEGKKITTILHEAIAIIK